VKDRIARAMIDAAERDGKIKPDTVIVEPTSGNTGIGLAFVCAARGYRFMATMPESMSLERRRMLKALGIGVGAHSRGRRHAGRGSVRRKSFVPKTRTTSSRSSSRTRRIPRSTARRRPKRFWRDTDGKVDIFVAGVGTGGTITGVAEVLKKRKPGFQAIAVEPANSPVITQKKVRPTAEAGTAHDPRDRRRLSFPTS